MSQSKLYVIGKKGEGVLFIRTSPLRVAQVSDEAVQAYEKSNPGVDGYARIASAARGMIATQSGAASSDALQVSGIEALVAGGAVVTEADFTFIGDVTDAGWDTNRDIQAPLAEVLSAIGPQSEATSDLFNAILSDSPNSAV